MAVSFWHSAQPLERLEDMPDTDCGTSQAPLGLTSAADPVSMASFLSLEQQTQLHKHNTNFDMPNFIVSSPARAPAWLGSSGNQLSDSQHSPHSIAHSGDASDGDDGAPRGPASAGGVKNGRARYLEKNRVAQVHPPSLPRTTICPI